MASSVGTWASSRLPGSPPQTGNARRTATAQERPSCLETTHPQCHDRKQLAQRPQRGKDLTTGPVQKHGGYQELPGVMEEGLLYEVEGGARGRPLPEGLSPGWTKTCVHTVHASQTHSRWALAESFRHYRLSRTCHGNKGLFSVCLPSPWTLVKQKQ